MAEVADKIKELADKIVGLTLKEAVDLAAHLKDAHGIEPAAGGVMMAAGPGGGGGAAPAEVEEAKSTFDNPLAEPESAPQIAAEPQPAVAEAEAPSSVASEPLPEPAWYVGTVPFAPFDAMPGTPPD